MIHFDQNYKDQLHIAWDFFIQNKDYDYSFIRPIIYDSWLRSRRFDVNPYQIKTSILSGEFLSKHLNSNIQFIETVRPYMEKLYSIVEGSGFYLLLSDKDGYILDLIGDKEIVEEGKRNSLLIIGANRSEKFAGTNAIGTCLTIKKPIQIWNEEHYINGHKHYACSSAPIFSPTGELLGCLNITGRYTDLHTHTLGMVISAVDGISKELKIKTAYDEIELISAQRNSIIESMPSGLLLLNMSDRIIQINKKALSILGLRYEEALGRNIFDIAEFDGFNKKEQSFFAVAHKIYNKEVNVALQNASSPTLKYNLSVNFVKDAYGKRGGTVLRLNETKLINRLVNQIGGFKSTFTFDSILGESPVMKDMINLAKQAAPSDSTILILGESGTGKELVAQSIHNASRYSKGPFVAINCGALPNGLIESELFGYEKGSFTGARADGNPGKFELADGGTLFLDEIGDMPLDIQVTLLRVLQTKEIVRIGATQPKKISVRIIAATNKDLRSAIENKTFREDLYYRLNVISIPVAPLNQRGADVSLLAQYFVSEHNKLKGTDIQLDPALLNLLQEYTWPGNVRELENAIERAINITPNDYITLEQLPQTILDYLSNKTDDGTENTYNANSQIPTPKEILSFRVPESPLRNVGLSIKDTNRQLIVSSLEQTGGNVTVAAELLGISRRTLYRKLEKYNISSEDYR